MRKLWNKLFGRQTPKGFRAILRTVDGPHYAESVARAQQITDRWRRNLHGLTPEQRSARSKKSAATRAARKAGVA